MPRRTTRCTRAARLCLFSAVCTLSSSAHAIRPFITDDARVVGGRLVQLETWWRRDKNGLQHWALGAVGPNEHVELTLGGVQGNSKGDGPTVYSVNGPLLQAKALIAAAHPNSWPGFAMAGGAVPPFGRGGFPPPGWSGFAYVAVTESLFDHERLLLHLNVGFSAVDSIKLDPFRGTWGVGSQLRLAAGLHAVAEVFSGDPYAEGSGGAVQTGLRYIFNDHIQLDATIGHGVFGDILPLWATSGVRLVSSPLW